MSDVLRVSRKMIEIDIDSRNTTLRQVKILIDNWNGSDEELIDTIRNLVMEGLDATA